MKHLQIPIPEKEDFKRWLEQAKFKLRGGFKCGGCGAIQSFRDIQFQSMVKGKRLIFSSSHKDYNAHKCVCPECVRKELNAHHKFVFTSHRECEWCKEHKMCTSFPRDERLQNHIHFGSGWWNGHYICQDCLNEGIDNREGLTSSNLEIIDGQTYMINELRLRIKQ